jgi:hypothetical protein
MGACCVKRDTEVIAKSRKLEVCRLGFAWVLLEIPERALQRAKNLVASWKVHVKPLVPRLQKLPIKLGVVRDKLGQMIGLAIGAQHCDAGMSPKKVRKIPGSFLWYKCVPGPYPAPVMVLSQATSVGPALIKANLCLESLDWLETLVDGNRGDLNDGMAVRIQAGCFKIKEDEFLAMVEHPTVCHGQSV